jgi:hypothetical protein
MSYFEKDDFPPRIHYDFHQEIAYDVYSSLYNMIGYFS